MYNVSGECVSWGLRFFYKPHLAHWFIYLFIVYWWMHADFSGMRSSDFMYKIMSIKLALYVFKKREITWLQTAVLIRFFKNNLVGVIMELNFGITSLRFVCLCFFFFYIK